VNLLRDRAGKGGMGCLGTIVLIVLVAYFGSRFIPPYMHYEQFRDEMKSDARFGATLPDSIIRMRLVAQADTLGLPPEAKRIVIRRHIGRPSTITISAEYTEKVMLPIFGLKPWHFKPKAEEPL
jgi:hypothetical protein